MKASTGFNALLSDIDMASYLPADLAKVDYLTVILEPLLELSSDELCLLRVERHDQAWMCVCEKWMSGLSLLGRHGLRRQKSRKLLRFETREITVT